MSESAAEGSLIENCIKRCVITLMLSIFSKPLTYNFTSKFHLTGFYEMYLISLQIYILYFVSILSQTLYYKHKQ